MPAPRPTLTYHLYSLAARGVAPLAWRSVSRKLRDHGVSEDRCRERLGHATKPRPEGQLVWFHAASVGESLSILTLINRMGQRLPQAEFLITSGTATSAELIAKRMPARTRHQFAPLDAPGPVGRFLDHWKPDAGIFVESELWPVTLARCPAPLALLNARLSASSVQGWKKRPDTARFVLGQFRLMLTQNAATADNLIAMGADPDRVRSGVNLKSTSDPLPVDTATLAELQTALGDRPVWVASSTHEGEEQPVLDAHKRLLESHPDLCLLLVPRHPERGDAVEALVREAGLTCVRRSKREALDGQQVYLADTLGEVGTWYAASPIVFLGGSLKPIGGHNPFEPAQAGAAVASGPHVTNFAETFTPLIAAGGAVEVEDAGRLAGVVAHWLDDSRALEARRKAAKDFAEGQQSALNGIIESLIEALELDHA